MFENLRNKELISERESYENVFFNMDDISKSMELEVMIDMFEDYENVFFNMDDISKSMEVDVMIDRFEADYSFDREDCLIRVRDLHLIEQCEPDIPDDEIIEKDILDYMIESYENLYFNEEDYIEYTDMDFEYYGDSDMDSVFFEEISMDSAYCGDIMIGYVREDDPFDRLDFFDYPEGPNENIEGFIYPVPVELPDFNYHEDFAEFELTFNEYCDEFNRNNHYLDRQIEIHLEEERNLIQYLKEYEMPKEVIVTAEGDEIIIC